MKKILITFISIIMLLVGVFLFDNEETVEGIYIIPVENSINK